MMNLLSKLKRGRKNDGMQYIYKFIPLLLIIVALVVRAVFSADYLSSTFLFQDDTIFIGHYLFNVDMVSPATQKFYYGMLEFLSGFNSLFPPKLFLFMMQALMGYCFYRIVFEYSRSYTIGVASAIFAISYPVSIDQNFFMAGAHPLAATTVFLVFLALFVRQLKVGLSDSLVKNGIWVLLLGAILLICVRSSPTYVLIPLILIPVVISLVMTDTNTAKFRPANIALIAFAFIPSLVQYFTAKQYHYGNVTGWTDYSPERVLGNFQKSLTHILIDPTSNFTVIKFTYIVLLAGIFLILLMGVIKYRNNKRTPVVHAIIVGGICLLSAAMVFGPSSITTSFITRYTYAPFILFVLVIFIGIGWIFTNYADQKYKIIVQLCLTCLAFVAIIHNINKTHKYLAPYLAGHDVIKETLSKNKWADNDQVLIVLPNKYRHGTMGFNHWSTWYLRVITGQPKLIGVITSNSDKRSINFDDLFINKYRDHGKEFWGTRNGRSYRKTMIGLEKRRVTTVYLPTEADQLQKTPMLVWDGLSLTSLQPSQETGKLKNMCQLLEQNNGAFIISISRKRSSEQPLYTTLITSSFSFDGTELQNVVVPSYGKTPSELVISFQHDVQNSKPGENKPYSKSNPPMPVVGPDFAVYTWDNIVDVRARNGASVKRKKTYPYGAQVEIKLSGCPGGLALLSMNGDIIGVIPQAKFSGQWTLGRGFLQRYWTGKIEFTLKTLEVNDRPGGIGRGNKP